MTTPDTVSGDYNAMAGYWSMVETILDGADAMRAAGTTYLPQFPNETETDYGYRRTNAKFTNIYGDIVSNLAAKPFSEAVRVSDDSASDRIKELVEDIDGRGNNLHVFAGNVFHAGINNAVDWILVEFSKATPAPGGRALTQAEEKAQGLRPYWVHVPARRMLAVYSDIIAGQEIITHARIREDRVERTDYTERNVERVRIFNREPVTDDAGQVTGYSPATYAVWEKGTVTAAANQPAGAANAAGWTQVETGVVSIGVIALVPFITGRRKGGSWQFVPPLKDAAFLQIEHYQQETALKSIKELTAFPMLAGNGVTPMMVDGAPTPVPVGPKSVLYAPPGGENGAHGEWTFIEPTAASLKFLAEDVKATEQQLRELGRQPLTAQTGNLTVVTTAFAAQKGNSAVQAWALNLKDALEQAFVLTCKWLGDDSKPVVNIFTDFDVGMTDDKGPDTLRAMRENGDLSQETWWSESKRRGFLSADFDAEAERQRLIDEMPGEDTEDDVGAALGEDVDDPAQEA